MEVEQMTEETMIRQKVDGVSDTSSLERSETSNEDNGEEQR